jgi:hypothetical protein
MFAACWVSNNYKDVQDQACYENGWPLVLYLEHLGRGNSDEALRLGPPNRVSVLSALFEGDKTVATRSYLK